MRSLSLRDRLLAGLVALVALGLTGFGAATYGALDNSLLRRTDDQVRTSAPFAMFTVLGGERGRGRGGPGGPGGAVLPAGTYAAEVDPSGSVIADHVFEFGSAGTSARPLLPRPLPATSSERPALVTVAGLGGVRRYRLLVMPTGSGTDLFVLAVPLTEVDATLNQLLQLELLLGGAVLLLIAGFSVVMIRFGLRPLEHMAEIASAIAAGDLARRVEPATPATEIGRLGLALNSMLSQIEDAFRRREASERRLRQFLADASHELRTPLTSIRGYAEMLRRGAGGSRQDAGIARRRIEEEAIRMTALVDDLLLLARLDQGRPLQHDPVDLRSIARDACADARAAAAGREITLEAPAPVLVEGDEQRLRQVMSNLLRNALVHTPSASPVEVQVAGGDGHATMAVVDHGPGLPEGAAERIFEPFFRADPGRSRDTGGAGLGLSIVAAVVAAHGGRVSAGPTPGGGATFRVALPLAVA